MADRFFVTVFARDAEHMRRLFEGRALDVFATRRDERKRPAVDGLMTLEDVGRLVEDGYEVLVAETDHPAEDLPRADFDEWLKATRADADERLLRGK
jgi:hypothetical protein